MKKTLLMATTALVAAGFAADAKAVDVELYGQVNKTIISADNGDVTEVAIRDNDKSSTRVGLKGEQALDNGLTASVLVEYEMNGDNTQDEDLFNHGTGGSSTLTERHARVGIAGDFGAVYMGHTSTATDGIAEIDMAGASDLLGSDIERFGGASTFRTTANADSGREVSNAFSNFDGTRADLVAYHTPVVSGFQGQLSTTEGGDVQAAVRYSGKHDAFMVKAGIGYEMNNDRAVADTLESTLAGSVSVKHDSGLSATVAYGQESREGSNVAEASSYYVKAGYAWDEFEVAADYSAFDADTAAADTDAAVEGEAWGLGGQYNLGHGVSVAGAYRNLSADNTTTSLQDIDLIMANLRVKF